MIEADFQEHYRVDLGEPGLLRSRSWRWLRVRITGLLAADTRLARALAPKEKKPGRQSP